MYLNQELKKFVVFLVLIGFVDSTIIDGQLIQSTIYRSFAKILEGVSTIGLQGLDPLKMVDLNLSTNGLNINYTNSALYGLKDAPVEYINADMDTKTINVKFSKWDSYFRGDYVASGKILDIPIFGQGELSITPKSMDLYAKLKFDIQTRNGKHFIITNGFSYNFDVNDHVEFYFSNLYNGDEKRSCKTLNEINKRWTEIRDNYSGPFMDRALDSIYRCVTIFFSKYSIEEINESTAAVDSSSPAASSTDASATARSSAGATA